MLNLSPPVRLPRKRCSAESHHSTGWDQRGAAEAVEETDRSSGSTTTSARFSRRENVTDCLHNMPTLHFIELLHEDSSKLQQKWWLMTFRITQDLTLYVQHYQSVIGLILNCESFLNTKQTLSIYSSVKMDCASFLGVGASDSLL